MSRETLQVVTKFSRVPVREGAGEAQEAARKVSKRNPPITLAVAMLTPAQRKLLMRVRMQYKSGTILLDPEIRNHRHPVF